MATRSTRKQSYGKPAALEPKAEQPEFRNARDTLGTDTRPPAAPAPGETQPAPCCPTHPGASAAGCAFTFNITAAGDVNIHNHCAPPPLAPGGGGPADDPCQPSEGSCLPAVAGAKHKLGRKQKLEIRAARAKVPSVLAASTVHGVRRYLSGATAANGLEQRLFDRLEALPKSFLRCVVAGFDSAPPSQRGKLFDAAIPVDPSQPVDPAALSAALLQEIKGRAALTLFGDPAAVEGERPGQNRLYVPVGEDFFSQVRICRVNRLRTANFIPTISPGGYLPDEIQQDCEPRIVGGTTEIVCEVRTSNCPGNQVDGVCGRVLDVGQGDSIELEGVNYFDVNARVRLTDRATGNVVRLVDAFIFGDVDTPREEVIDGTTRLINDCRVHDKATFAVPNDLPSGLYAVQVLVPNSTGNPVFGTEIGSNEEFINVLPSPDARFQIVVENVRARVETAPASWGSDEVGLRTIATALSLSSEPLELRETRFPELDGVEFDSATQRRVDRIVFSSDQPILAVTLAIMGHEIDSDRAYNQQITEWSDVFVDVIKDQWKEALALLSAAGGLAALTPLGWTAAIGAAIVGVVVVAIDLIYSIWAPADLIVEDVIALSVSELDHLTSFALPAPPERSFKSFGGLTVNVNASIPPEKLPLQYRETREYVSSEEESRYEITYRYNRLS